MILAAGEGTRIKPLNLEYPKPLLPICNKPIIEYQIEDMQKLGITEIYIVIGHLGAKIKHYLGNGQKWHLQINYVQQKERLGIAHAVGQLEPYIHHPFILFLGDIFYIAPRLAKMITLFRKTKAGSVLAVKKEKDPNLIKRNFALILNRHKLVKRVIEKPRYVPNNLKGCGIYLFDLPIFDAIRNTPRTAMRDEYEITTAIQLLIDYGYKVYPAAVVQADMNLTFAQDLLECNLRELQNLQKKKLIDPTARIGQKVLIQNSIIGSRVQIQNNVRVENSVIFPGVKIWANQKIINAIVTPRLTIQADQG